MDLSERYPVTGVYRVEVSGWDTSQSFFVEKTELRWDEIQGKMLLLSRPLHKGSVVFVRLLQVVDPAQYCPIAYEVEPLGPATGALFEFRLRQLHPRLRDVALQIKSV